MKRTSSLVAALAASIGSGACAQTVITNPGFTLAAADVRGVYVGEKLFAGTLKLVPVDNAAAQEQFLGNLVKVDSGKYGLIWAKKSFREGVNPPQAKATDSEVLDFVRRTPGGVGYILDASKATGVNVVK
jgi:hypothetical protein